MVKRDGLAEIRIGGAGVALYGAMRTIEPPHVTLELITAPVGESLVRPGQEVELVYSRSGNLYASVMQVASLANSSLDLRFASRPTPAHRRAGRRVRCGIPVQYRVVRPDGHTGAWLECVTDDLSPGGIGLLIPASTELPNRVELLFHLPTVAPVDDDAPLRGAESQASAGPPVKASGRVVHCRRSTLGRTRCGTAFSSISPADRERIARFADHLRFRAA